ncbi:MAG: HNH endonuclease signature motif containing protein [Lachnospiraceae bacterium]|nr:HNH endonuclease signature motif containing protein [Lachnospiraceae bacterium]
MNGRGECGTPGDCQKPKGEGKKTRTVVSPHKYTEKEHEFMRSYILGHGRKEIQKEFKEKFGCELTINQVKAYIRKSGIKTGLNGQFKKGMIPKNKGQKGVCDPRCKKTWFKKGHVPVGHKPVGSERINVDGYIEIKVKEPNVWRLKQRVVWEVEHGPIPPGHVIVFADGNRENVKIDNLRMISRSELQYINRLGIKRESAEITDAAIAAAELKESVKRAKERKKKNG